MGLDMFDFIRQLYASSRQTALERVRSPVLGAFVFSWLGFNWQLLLLLARSKEPIEQTLKLINHDFGIESLLIGPIFTTILICLLLPRINKLVTKWQDAPNEQTVIINLSSKIKIAELQQTIADIEARKKLAEKKEERFIEEGIHNIRAERDRLLIIEKEKNTEILKSKEKENKLFIEVGKLNAEIIIKDKENSSKDNEMKALNKKITQLDEEKERLFKTRLELESKNKNLHDDIIKLQAHIEKIDKLLKKMEEAEIYLAKTYPNIFSRLEFPQKGISLMHNSSVLIAANEKQKTHLLTASEKMKTINDKTR